MFFVKTAADESMHESADDMTAAAIVPMAIIDIGNGTKYLITSGNTKLRSDSDRSLFPLNVSYDVWFQSDIVFKIHKIDYSTLLSI